LILLRWIVVDKERGHKLEPRWEGPYVVTRRTKSGRPVYYATLQNPTIELGRRHMNQVRIDVPREEGQFMRINAATTVVEDDVKDGPLVREMDLSVAMLDAGRRG